VCVYAHAEFHSAHFRLIQQLALRRIVELTMTPSLPRKVYYLKARVFSVE